MKKRRVIVLLCVSLSLCAGKVDFLDRIANMVKTINLRHLGTINAPDVAHDIQTAGKKVSALTIQFAELQEMREALEAVEKLKWESKKRSDATSQLINGIRFAFALHNANTKLKVNAQELIDGELITTFSKDDPPTLDYATQLYGALSYQPVLHFIDFPKFSEQS